MKIYAEVVNQYMFQKLDELIAQNRLEGKKIILFGMNTSSYATKNYLGSKGYQVYAYIDNNAARRETVNNAIEDMSSYHIRYDFSGEFKENLIPVYSPEGLLKEFDGQAAILIASKYYSQMRMQLEDMGYRENIHIFQTVDFHGMEQIFQNLKDGDCGQEMTVEEVKHSQIGSLDYLRGLCQKNGLRYYICGGTLLGAVRHKGYIPWDDDIDVIMPYSDYKEMIRLVSEENGQYKIWSPYTYAETYFCFHGRLIDGQTIMKAWEYPFLMTEGVNIDIFPLSGMPEGEQELIFFYNKVRRLYTQFVSTFVETVQETGEVVNKRKGLHAEILHFLEMYDFDHSKMSFTLGRNREKEILPVSIYEKSIELPFEGSFYTAAAGYETYLTALYGDYMKLPPENQRDTNHNFKAFWRRGRGEL